ncbi:TrkA C-terminal domain-containing protein [Metalysinibacillus jejuensis]|uniref:TrkA C-terminal domain-containing protein n=1 Tax=Metalysinibacillus jejuensis TaxID=914327 RepID=UPI000D396993|nr:TrkA C-terminal domain-containing protein [Metalysinibacillus jejuensis]
MTAPRYVKIAMDVAERIYRGEFAIGEKVRGRSTLAGQYGVSPETVRRATSLLSEMGVVKVYDKSGIYIESREQAYAFLQRYRTKQNFQEIRERITQLQQQKQAIEKELNLYLDMYMEYAMGLEQYNSKDVFRFILTEDSGIINKTVASTQFWRHTNATILSVTRAGKAYISPGPNFVFQQDDEITVVCEPEHKAKLQRFLHGGT